jgi:hypothetical protein
MTLSSKIERWFEVVVVAFKSFTPSTTGVPETRSYPPSGREVERCPTVADFYT